MNEITTRFVTFYSYKGGVGRTSALVNVAVLRAMQGNNVLILDFDLEAPGTTPYLKKLDPDYNEHKEGLLEYFDAAIDGSTVPNLVSKATDLSGCIGTKNGGHLWAINAGNTIDPNYTARLDKLNWSDIFERKFGELLLRNFRNQIIEEFAMPDYVFIDSRTGITEIGGVCTRYLADKLVILTSLNEKNINGTAMIHNELSQEGKDTILVAANVPVGMPYSSNQLFSQRIDTFKDRFGRLPHLFVYYYPVLSLSEELPALLSLAANQTVEPKTSLFNNDPLLQSYRRLAQVIDRPRKGQISYMSSLKEASRALSLYIHTKDMPKEVTVLTQYYPERFLAKAILDVFEFTKQCLQSTTSPTDWDKSEYKRLLEIDTETTNQSVKRSIEALKDFVYGLVRKYLVTTGTMDRSLEIFLDEARLGIFTLEEISRKRFDWPIDFLKRQLETMSADDHLNMAANLFNQSYCLLQIGDDTGHTYLKHFLGEFKQLDLSNYSAATLVNYYFCAALAYKELGFMKEARSMYAKSEKQISLLKPDTTAFSPIDYKLIQIEELRKQLKYSADKALSKITLNPRTRKSVEGR